MVVLALFALSQARSATYWEEYQARLKQDGPGPKLQKFLDDGAAAHADDPDYCAAAANYQCRAASELFISTKPAAKGDLVLSDQKTGKPVGSIALGSIALGRENTQVPPKALKILEEGTRRFPRRADIALGLASLQFKSGSHAACTATLLRLLATAQKDPASLRWMGDAPLPSSPQKFIPESVYDYCAKLYELNTRDGDTCCRQLCDQLIRNDPGNPKPLNLLAALADNDHKPEEALQWLQKAHAADPKDALVLMNLADTSRKLGQTDEALDAWKQVVALPDADEEYKRAARAAMGKLPQPAPSGTPR